MPKKTEIEKELDRRRRTGNALRLAREKAGLTLLDVKKHTGLSVPYLSDVERGNRDIKPVKLHSVITAMRLSAEEAVGIYREAECLPPVISRLILSIPDLWMFDLVETVKHAKKNSPAAAVTREMPGWTR